VGTRFTVDASRPDVRRRDRNRHRTHHLVGVAGPVLPGLRATRSLVTGGTPAGRVGRRLSSPKAPQRFLRARLLPCRRPLLVHAQAWPGASRVRPSFVFRARGRSRPPVRVHARIRRPSGGSGPLSRDFTTPTIFHQSSATRGVAVHHVSKKTASRYCPCGSVSFLTPTQPLADYFWPRGRQPAERRRARTRFRGTSAPTTTSQVDAASPAFIREVFNAFAIVAALELRLFVVTYD